ncbi:MAG TPA: hypothetical protein VHU83_14550 [Bryobacteraceae bacterium]|jgi:hypothetical protein|nr:hypothetical protein [Bryobacteraceae bacterium]
MEHEIRELLEQHVAERDSVLDQIEAAWSGQKTPANRQANRQVDRSR